MIIQGRILQLILLVVFFSFSILYINLIRRGTLKVPTIRKLPQLEAIPEAIGRATEMGRPVHFSTGWNSYITTSKSAYTIAGLSVLSKIAELCAENGTPLLCSVSTGEVLPLYQAIVQEAYIKAGKAEDYRQENIIFQSEQQFAWLNATIGLLSRNNVAANIMIGGFHAEALALAETGNILGAIQIAGTNSTWQTPIFIAACDYVLIGEEMFAAGALVSDDVSQIGSLAVGDVFKVFIIAISIMGSILLSIGNDWIIRIFEL